MWGHCDRDRTSRNGEMWKWQSGKRAFPSGGTGCPRCEGTPHISQNISHPTGLQPEPPTPMSERAGGSSGSQDREHWQQKKERRGKKNIYQRVRNEQLQTKQRMWPPPSLLQPYTVSNSRPAPARPPRAGEHLLQEQRTQTRQQSRVLMSNALGKAGK